MTIDPKQLAEAIEYVNDFAVDIDEEGLDRDGNARHFFAVVEAAKAHLAYLTGASAIKPPTNTKPPV